MVTRSCKNSGLFFCIILKVSKAIVLILRVLNECNLEFWRRVSYELSESLSGKIYKRVHGQLFYLIFLDISRHVLKIRECYSDPI